MAKKQDPFEKFKEITLGNKTINEALAVNKNEEAGKETSEGPANTVARTESVPQEQAKPANPRENQRLVSFYIDKELFKRLGHLKVLTGIKYEALYNEAVKDLLEKYEKTEAGMTS